MANKNIVDLLNHLASRKADVSSVYTTEEVNSLTGANRELIEANTQADIDNYNSLKEYIDEKSSIEDVKNLTERVAANEGNISLLKTDSVALTVSNDKVNASSLKLGEGVLYPAEDLL
jgi:hypothetical protein